MIIISCVQIWPVRDREVQIVDFDPKPSSKSKNAPSHPPSKFNFPTFGNICTGPRPLFFSTAKNAIKRVIPR